jgi:outer membrane protein TolC
MPSGPPAGVPASLLDRRPDLVAAERRLAAADRKYAAARLLILPTIRLTGSGGTASEMVENLIDRNFSVWSLASSAVQPILSGGSIKYGVRLRRSEIAEAASNYEKLVLVAFREVEDALDLEQFLARREALLVKAVDLADDAYEKATQEFVDGVGDILTLLSAQQRKVQSEAQLITIRRLRLDNRVDLHLALGGDYRARKKS